MARTLLANAKVLKKAIGRMLYRAKSFTLLDMTWTSEAGVNDLISELKILFFSRQVSGHNRFFCRNNR